MLARRITHDINSTMASTELLDRLQRHRVLGRAPREELVWLAGHGETRRYAVGDVVYRHGTPSEEMLIVLAGHVVQYVDRGAGVRKFMEWHGGEVTGLLPFSRMVSPPGDSVIEEAAEILTIRRSDFPALINACPAVTASLVHTMLDRARDFTSSHFQDEKIMSLGRLAAGLAHELNNPASAAARSATRLREALAEATSASSQLGSAHLTESQRERLESLRHLNGGAAGVQTAIERADLEQALADWLETKGVDSSSAPMLADRGVRVEQLNELSAGVAAESLSAGIQLLAAEYTVQSLASDIDHATARIHALVSAMKRFTNMDRPTVAEPTDVAQGLADTVAVMTARAREKSLVLRLETSNELPPVRGHAAELMQVWSNLIDNALDATSASGQIVVSAVRDHDDVVVRVVDDGPGIPPPLQARVFDPFFTTKPVGEGTGLGLDIARRIVRLHRGEIDVESRPGRTEFRVTLPAVMRAEAP
jgi:signal transduction histidine kinase